MRLELTSRGSYAVRATIALARADGTVLPARSIAERTAIPVGYVPQVMTGLVRAGLVEAVLGRQGGYRLAKSADLISLLDVIEAVEAEPRRRTCVLRGNRCGVEAVCDVHGAFEAAQEALLSRLAEQTISSIAAPSPS